MESVPTVTPTPEITPSVTPEITPSVTPEISPTVTPTPTTSDILDSDQDGLADSEEIELGTDLNDADTDDDGLNDYIDLMLEYDPLNRDSNANGISDGDEDYDSDGLANLDEFVIGTFIGASDSYYDNLSDGDEVNTYGTNPLIFDTDDDGVGDGEEIILGKNPADSTDGTQKVTQTLTKEINNSEDGSITSVEITMATSRVIDNVVSIKDMYNKDTYSMNAVGRIGSPLKFDSDEEFDTVKVVIHYDETLLNNANEADLGVL